MNNALDQLKTLTYGTELEYTNISRQRAATAIFSVTGGTMRYRAAQVGGPTTETPADTLTGVTWQWTGTTTPVETKKACHIRRRAARCSSVPDARRRRRRSRR